MSLVQLVYVSRATCPMSWLDLRTLVEKSRRANVRRNVSGLLLYSAGHFMQLLEGERSVVLALAEKISQDPRHDEFQILHLEAAQKRLFDHWSMGLLSLEAEDRYLDRDRLAHVVDRARMFRESGQGLAGNEAIELLKDFRAQLPKDQPELVGA